MPGKRKYYWDSSCFIAWLTAEKRKPGELEGMEEIVKEVNSGKADLFTSEITKSEVLEGRMTPAQRDMFTKLFQRKNVISVDVSGRVLAIVKEIREWNYKISVPDAIHLATAILYGADEFHTTDGAGKRKRAGDLIPLSGNVAGHNLKICAPEADQFGLNFHAQDKREADAKQTLSKTAEVQRGSSGPTQDQTGAEESDRRAQAAGPPQKERPVAPPMASPETATPADKKPAGDT
jgi:predicted nucleic acid-binding protein